MKSFTAVAVLVLAILACVSAKSVKTQYADKDFLVKQKFMLEVLQHIHQDYVFVTKYDESYYEYKPWEHLDHYNNLEKFEHFLELWQHMPMYDDEVFSIVNERHEEYAKGLVRLFYNAKDWTTFTHAVMWARLHCNKHLFVYSLTVASLFRKDLEGVVLPAIYEIEPRFFFDADTVELAEKYKMSGFYNVKKLDNIYNLAIRSNYTNVYGDVNDDHNLAYFLEDIGLNAFYYYYNIDYPRWSSGPEGHELNKDRRGELYFYVHWQLLARYYLERLSHDLGEIPVFNMWEPVESGYFSNLHYHSGVSFPDRDNQYNFYYPANYEDVNDVHFYSQRIIDFIDKNNEESIDIINVLGNIVHGNRDSIDKQFYGSIDNLYRNIVNEGRPYGKYHETLPSTFMHYETSIRDPLFYGVYKEIVWYYWRLMGTFPAYTKSDLEFPGVQITDVHVPEALTTYFEYFDSDISNVVNVEVPTHNFDDPLLKFGRNSHYNGHSYVIKARQFRLNHKPFEFTLDVISDKDHKAVVKIFIGPKYDENGRLMHLEHNYMNFFELDHFHVDLVSGTNSIKRNSNEFYEFVDDRTTYYEIYQKVMDATNTDYKFALNQKEAHCGVPNRMMLPKGKRGGMLYQFFFVVYPYHTEAAAKPEVNYNAAITCGIGSGNRYIDELPFGFPFNRLVKHGYYFDVDNFKFHDVKIFHKDETANVV